ncbi:MAG TPA: CRISPR-associated endonuclease Cas2 [Spirochaetota bacterium]|nr:CRISPR-associated endonuclease Cas2 [Spirochaetota bacterium]
MKKWLIIYDIRDEKRLARIAKILLQFGFRVQKSVFELECGPVAVSRLRKKVKAVMENEDSFMIFDLCPRCWQKKRQIGIKAGIPYEDVRYRVL